MAEKKMTQMQALETIVEVLSTEIAANGYDGDVVEAVEIVKGMVEKRKNVTRKPRVNKEAEAFREKLLEILEKAEGPMTNAELAAFLEVKPQKVANNIHVLEKADKVIRIRGEKASDKDTFVIA